MKTDVRNLLSAMARYHEAKAEKHAAVADETGGSVSIINESLSVALEAVAYALESSALAGNLKPLREFAAICAAFILDQRVEPAHVPTSRCARFPLPEPSRN